MAGMFFRSYEMAHLLNKQMVQAGFQLPELRQSRTERLIEINLDMQELKVPISIVGTFFKMETF